MSLRAQHELVISRLQKSEFNNKHYLGADPDGGQSEMIHHTELYKENLPVETVHPQSITVSLSHLLVSTHHRALNSKQKKHYWNMYWVSFEQKWNQMKGFLLSLSLHPLLKALYLHYDVFISKCLKMLFLPLLLVCVFMRMPQIKIKRADTSYIDLFRIIKLLPSLDLHMIATDTIQCIFKKDFEAYVNISQSAAALICISSDRCGTHTMGHTWSRHDRLRWQTHVW